MQERFAAYTRTEVHARRKKLAVKVRAVAEHTNSHYLRAVLASLKKQNKPRASIADDLSLSLPRLASVGIEQYLLEGSTIDEAQLRTAIEKLVVARKIDTFEDDGVTVYRLKDEG